MYRLIVLCVLATVTLSVTADDSGNALTYRQPPKTHVENSYRRRPLSYGEDKHGDHSGHTHGGSDDQKAGISTGHVNTQPLLGQDGHGQLGYQGGYDHAQGHDHTHGHDHAHGQGSDNYLYKKHGY